MVLKMFALNVTAPGQKLSAEIEFSMEFPLSDCSTGRKSPCVKMRLVIHIVKLRVISQP